MPRLEAARDTWTVLIFFDTEFSTLRDGRLLSVGLVAADGREFYVEIPGDGINRDASDFVRAHVLSQFEALPDCAAGTLFGLGERVAAFLEQFATRVELCCDHKLDRRFVEEALSLSTRWKTLQPNVGFVDVAGQARSEAAKVAVAASFAASAPLLQHHALADARALRAGWLAERRAGQNCTERQ